MVQTSFIVALVAILSAASNALALPLAVDVSVRDVNELALEVRTVASSAFKTAKNFAEELASNGAQNVVVGLIKGGSISYHLKQHPPSTINRTPIKAPSPPPPTKPRPPPVLSHETQEQLRQLRLKDGTK